MISSWLFSLYEGDWYFLLSGRLALIGALVAAVLMVIWEARGKSGGKEIPLAGAIGLLAGGIGTFALCGLVPGLVGCILWILFL